MDEWQAWLRRRAVDIAAAITALAAIILLAIFGEKLGALPSAIATAALGVGVSVLLIDGLVSARRQSALNDIRNDLETSALNAFDCLTQLVGQLRREGAEYAHLVKTAPRLTQDQLRQALRASDLFQHEAMKRRVLTHARTATFYASVAITDPKLRDWVKLAADSATLAEELWHYRVDINRTPIPLQAAVTRYGYRLKEYSRLRADQPLAIRIRFSNPGLPVNGVAALAKAMEDRGWTH